MPGTETSGTTAGTDMDQPELGRSVCRDESPLVWIELSRSAAVFLRATVEHMNQAKILPADNAIALETSAWLEEIEAKTREALT